MGTMDQGAGQRARQAGVSARGTSVLGGCVLGAVLLAGGPALAQSWSQHTQDGKPALLYESDDSGESVGFTARCSGGQVQVMYALPSRSTLKGGTAKACDSERPCREKLPVAFLVDGKATALQARAVPEMMYDGYEIRGSLSTSSPFWAQLQSGGTLALKVDGTVAEKIPLKSGRAVIAKFVAACGK